MKKLSEENFAAAKEMSFAAKLSAVASVDEEKRELKEVSICNVGEALGHDIWLDDAFVRACIEQGNAAENGLLCHFGHEDSNASRIKNYMGVLKNFIEKPSKDHEGNEVIGCFADIELSDAAAELSDNVKWVLSLAKERPDALGMSIVFDLGGYKLKLADGTETEWRFDNENLDSDGAPETAYQWYARNVDNSDGRLFALLGTLHGADFVAEGAATRELFEAKETELDSLKKRMAGLQAAKDKELEQLKADFENYRQDAETKLADCAARLEAVSDVETLKADFENLKTEHQQNVEALAAANTAREQLQAELDSAKLDLARTANELAAANEHLTEWQNHAHEHGVSVNNPPAEFVKSDEEVMNDRMATPAQKLQAAMKVARKRRAN